MLIVLFPRLISIGLMYVLEEDTLEVFFNLLEVSFVEFVESQFSSQGKWKCMHSLRDTV